MYHLGDITDFGQRSGMAITLTAIGALTGPPISGAISKATEGFSAVGYYAGSVILASIVMMLITRHLALGKLNCTAEYPSTPRPCCNYHYLIYTATLLDTGSPPAHLIKWWRFSGLLPAPHHPATFHPFVFLPSWRLPTLSMARSTPQNKSESSISTTCDQCGASMRRIADLPRHMLLHAKNKEEFMFTCPVAVRIQLLSVDALHYLNSNEFIKGCTHQTLQKSNLDTHIRTHTRAQPHKCPEYLPNGQKCLFATADPSSLHRHRKRKHGYQPRVSPSSTKPSRSAPVASGSGSREKSVE
ncbi:hypothetical protein C8F04DRAFT_1368282 [Mycena alexandri]|uniref:C2H2-type domain-containing protein n=1 Tax=Mycena alexandri TaxID=1745969 RepID=A0AAD6X084_9AGAR|nr:hypothetical protein C8F04DRAFT_1368282 [Mycena alexandri]